jgi:hypothetical protein
MNNHTFYLPQEALSLEIMACTIPRYWFTKMDLMLRYIGQIDSTKITIQMLGPYFCHTKPIQ